MAEMITPKEYFDEIKGRKKYMTDQALVDIYNNCLTLLNKYKITGQIDGMKKLLFLVDTIEKEREIVKLGINTFVYKEDVETYIEEISDKAVKIIGMHQYEREIPDDIVALIEKVKDKFDKFYIVFTDYTGEMTKKVEKERRDKDPILFATFTNIEDSDNPITDRFYYLGDWVDEYCDLTLDKMVAEMQAKTSTDIRRTIHTPEDISELKQQLAQLDKKKNPPPAFTVAPPPPRETLFKKVKTFLNKE